MVISDSCGIALTAVAKRAAMERRKDAFISEFYCLNEDGGKRVMEGSYIPSHGKLGVPSLRDMWFKTSFFVSCRPRIAHKAG